MSVGSDCGKYDTMSTASLQIKVIRRSDTPLLLGASSAPSTPTVTRSRSTRSRKDVSSSSATFASRHLRPPTTARSAARSLSPALRSGGHALPTRSPTPPGGVGSCKLHPSPQPRTPPSSPAVGQKRLQSRLSPSPSTSCPSSPRLLAPNHTSNRGGSATEIVRPRRASALSRSPSPSPSLIRRDSSIKMANILTQKLVKASTTSSGSSSNIRLSNLTPPTSRKFCSVDERSDSSTASPNASPRLGRKVGTVKPPQEHQRQQQRIKGKKRLLLLSSPFRSDRRKSVTIALTPSN